MYIILFPDPLPVNPTGLATPSNLDLFGTVNTVFLGEVVVTSSYTNNWITTSFTIDKSLLTMPARGINDIMVTNSNLPFKDNGKMFLGCDNFG